jgi:hypothetical protein
LVQELSNAILSSIFVLIMVRMPIRTRIHEIKNDRANRSVTQGTTTNPGTGNQNDQEVNVPIVVMREFDTKSGE